jgi:hypothetical protein
MPTVEPVAMATRVDAGHSTTSMIVHGSMRSGTWSETVGTLKEHVLRLPRAHELVVQVRVVGVVPGRARFWVRLWRYKASRGVVGVPLVAVLIGLNGWFRHSPYLGTESAAGTTRSPLGAGGLQGDATIPEIWVAVEHGTMTRRTDNHSQVSLGYSSPWNAAPATLPRDAPPGICSVPVKPTHDQRGLNGAPRGT